jgi:hypothetical protein
MLLAQLLMNDELTEFSDEIRTGLLKNLLKWFGYQKYFKTKM